MGKQRRFHPPASSSKTDPLLQPLDVENSGKKVLRFGADEILNGPGKSSPVDQKKETFVRKEQKIRSEQLEKENQRYIRQSSRAPYGADRMQYLDIQATRTESTDGEVEWTPQDSSYGAAFPCFGFVPKRIRQAIERVLIVISLILTIYMIVSTAIKLSSGLSSSSSSSNLHMDDDFYVENGADDDANWNAYYNTYDDDNDDLFDD